MDCNVTKHAFFYNRPDVHDWIRAGWLGTANISNLSVTFTNYEGHRRAPKVIFLPFGCESTEHLLFLFYFCVVLLLLLLLFPDHVPPESLKNVQCMKESVCQSTSQPVNQSTKDSINQY